jgi:MFS family permease
MRRNNTGQHDRLPSAFWRQFAASSFSNFGDGIIAAAGPLLALSLTDDARLIAAVNVAAMLPWLVLSLPAGVLIDRFERRRILATANLVRAALFGLLAIGIAANAVGIWVLIAVMGLVAVCEVFFDMSAQAFLPEIVDESQLERANGRLYAAEFTSNSFLGLPLGAWLFVVAASAPFGVQAAALAAAAALVAGIATRPRPGGAGMIGRNGMMADIREGIGWLWGNPLLRLLALMLGAVNMCQMFGQAVFAKYARDELGLGARGFGLLLVAMSVGSIVGGLAGSRVARRLGPAVAVVGAYATFAALEVVPAVLPVTWAVAASGVAMSIAGTVWNVVTVSLRQRLIPAELFGRVNSVYRLIGTGTMAIGAVIGGQIAHFAGLRATYAASAAILVVVLAVGAPRLIVEFRLSSAANG